MASRDTERAEPSPRRPGFLSSRGFWISFGVAVVLVVALRVALPFVLASVAVAQAEEQGWRIQIASVDLALATGHLGVDGLEIIPPGPEASEPHRIGRAVLDISWRRTLFGERSLAIDDIRIEGAQLALERDSEGRWLGIPDFDTDDPAPEEEVVAEEIAEDVTTAWSLESTLVRLVDARLAFRDVPESRVVELSLSDLAVGEVVLSGGDSFEWSVGSIALAGFDTQIKNAEEPSVEVLASGRGDRIRSGADSDGHIRVRLESDGGTLELETLAVLSGPVEGAMLRWKNWPLASLLTLSSPELRAALRSGESDGELKIDFDPTKALKIAGTLALRDIDLKSALDDDGEVSVKWSELRAEIASLDLSLAEGAAASPAVEIASLALDSPLIQWRMPSGEQKEFEAEPEKDEKGEDSDPAEPAVRLGVAKLTVRNAEVGVLDPAFDPPLPTRLQQIDIDARNLRWPEQKVGQLDLAIGSLGKEPLRLSGSRGPRFSDFELKGKEISLALVAPYLRRSAGYDLDSGRLSVSSTLKADGDRFKAPTRLILHDLAIEAEEATGSAFENLFGVPLDVALMLLRDTQGDIELDLALAGDRDGAGVSLVDLTRQALQGAITGALASPLKIASSFMSDDGAGSRFRIEPVRFEPGSASFETFSAEALASIDQLLTAEPKLGLRLEVTITEDDEKKLRGSGAEDPGKPAAALVTLAAERLEAVRAGLVRGVPSLEGRAERVAVAPWQGTVSKGKGQVRGHLAVVQAPAVGP